LKNGIGNEVIGRRHGRIFHMPLDKALKIKPRFNRKLYQLINSL